MRYRSSLLVAFLMQASVAAHADTISLRADEWCPYNCTPGAKPGYVVELATQIFAAKGHTIDYQTLNWSRAIAETREGKFTGIIGASLRDAPDFVFPAEEVGQSKACFFVKSDSTWTFSGISSLSGKSFGVIKDYSYEDSIDDYVKGNPAGLQVASGDTALETNVKKLSAGRIDVVIENEAVMKNLLKAQSLESAVKEAGCVKNDPIYIAFSPKDAAKSKEYSEILSAGIDEFRKNGKLKQILDGYGLADWK